MKDPEKKETKWTQRGCKNMIMFVWSIIAGSNTNSGKGYKVISKKPPRCPHWRGKIWSELLPSIAKQQRIKIPHPQSNFIDQWNTKKKDYFLGTDTGKLILLYVVLAHLYELNSCESLNKNTHTWEINISPPDSVHSIHQLSTEKPPQAFLSYVSTL